MALSGRRSGLGYGFVWWGLCDSGHILALCGGWYQASVNGCRGCGGIPDGHGNHSLFAPKKKPETIKMRTRIYWSKSFHQSQQR